MAEWARLEGTATSKCNVTRTRALSPREMCGCSSGLGVPLVPPPGVPAPQKTIQTGKAAKGPGGLGLRV